MKAIVCTKYGPPEVLEVREVATPLPRDNEVLIRIRATTVVATDPLFRQGKPFVVRFFNGLTKPTHATPGDVLSGEVESVGRAVTRFQKGDQVFAACAVTQGGQAEYICLPEDGPLALKPANMSHEEAAGVGDGGLGALTFLRATKLRAGQSILINGASGSVGIAAVQLARYFGAQVTGVCGPRNGELVKSLGAHEVLDYTRVDFTRSGKTYDVIFDVVAKSTFAGCRGALTEDGVYLSTFPTPGLLLRSLAASQGRGKRTAVAAPGLLPAADKARELTFLKGLIEAGSLKSVIDRRFSLDQIQEAHRYVETGHKRGDVVISV